MFDCPRWKSQYRILFYFQLDSMLMIKNYIPRLTKSEFHCFLIGNHATVAGFAFPLFVLFGVRLRLINTKMWHCSKTCTTINIIYRHHHSTFCQRLWCLPQLPLLLPNLTILKPRSLKPTPAKTYVLRKSQLNKIVLYDNMVLNIHIAARFYCWHILNN